MASSSTRKQCANGEGCKQAAVTNCEGCSKAFCVKHFSEHRRLLDEEMNVIIDEYDYLKNTLNQQTIEPDLHPLIKDINTWEKESIVKVQQRAEDLRQEILRSITAHESQLSKRLQELSEKLKESRDHDDFIEIDLQQWKKTLDNLKTALVSPSTISINRDDNSLLVQNISIRLLKMPNDLFERVSDGRVRIESKGQVAVRDASQDCTEIRGKNEYESGRHEVCLQIEQSSDYWIFLGINSKATPLQCYSPICKSAYGWSSNNTIWLNGSEQLNKSNSLVEMKTNDIISLIFDCDNHQISMINDRTKRKHELTVNINNCPFPWQLHLNLYEPQDSVRIL
jgi:hypothetical protein